MSGRAGRGRPPGAGDRDRVHDPHPASMAAISAAPVRRDSGPPSATSAPAWAGRSASVPAQTAGWLTGPAAQPSVDVVIAAAVNILHSIVNPFPCLDGVAEIACVPPGVSAAKEVDGPQQGEHGRSRRKPATCRAEEDAQHQFDFLICR